MARSLHNKELFPPHLLPKDSGVANRLLRLFEIPIVSECALLLVVLGTVYVSAYVFLDFRVSKYMSLFGL